jgi:dTDP-4-dehydrorhamnose 3,5-epimerase
MLRDAIRDPFGETQASLDEVEGFTAALAKQSYTKADGTLRLEPIEGVQYRLARPVSHRHGHLTEAFRADWGITEAAVVQVNLTTTFPRRIRAWGIHRLTVDRLFAATGSLCVVCYDGRRGSSTHGCLYHGWQNVGEDEATIVSMPSQLYDHEGPDRWELPWDSAEAQAMIPYRWL